MTNTSLLEHTINPYVNRHLPMSFQPAISRSSFNLRQHQWDVYQGGRFWNRHHLINLMISFVKSREIWMSASHVITQTGTTLRNCPDKSLAKYYAKINVQGNLIWKLSARQIPSNFCQFTSWITSWVDAIVFVSSPFSLFSMLATLLQKQKYLSSK